MMTPLLLKTGSTLIFVGRNFKFINIQSPYEKEMLAMLQLPVFTISLAT